MFKRCSQNLSVEQIQKGKHLSSAVEKEVQELLDLRLYNPPRKAFVGIWLILYEDDRYVYWGMPRFRRIFSNARIVEKLYKTDKNSVLNKYPAYKKDFYGLELKPKLLMAISEYEKTQAGSSFQHGSLLQNFKVQAAADCLHIEAQCQVEFALAAEADKKTVQLKTYKIMLRHSDLAVLSVEII